MAYGTRRNWRFRRKSLGPSSRRERTEQPPMCTILQTPAWTPQTTPSIRWNTLRASTAAAPIPRLSFPYTTTFSISAPAPKVDLGATRAECRSRRGDRKGRPGQLSTSPAGRKNFLFRQGIAGPRMTKFLAMPFVVFSHIASSWFRDSAPGKIPVRGSGMRGLAMRFQWEHQRRRQHGMRPSPVAGLG